MFLQSKSKIAAAVLAALLTLPASQAVYALDISSAGDQEETHEVTVTGEQIDIGTASAWKRGIFHIGDSATQTVTINSLALWDDSTADIQGATVTLNNYTQYSKGSLDVEAGNKLTLGILETANDKTFTSGAGSKVTLESLGTIDAKTRIIAENGGTISAKSLGDITLDEGITVRSNGAMTLHATDSKIQLSSGDINLLDSAANQTSKLDIKSKTFGAQNSTIRVLGYSTYDYASSTEHVEKKTAFSFSGENFNAKSFNGIGSTISIDASKEIFLDASSSWDRKAAFLQNADLILGNYSTEKVLIKGGIHAMGQNKATSHANIQAADIQIDATKAFVSVFGKGSELQIGNESSSVNISANKISADAGSLFIDGKTITATYASDDSYSGDRLLEALQAGHVKIGHETTEKVALTGQIATSSGSDSETHVLGSTLEINGLDISVNRAKPQNPTLESFPQATLNAAGGDKLRIGNLEGGAETQLLTISGVVAASGGDISLYGDTISINGAKSQDREVPKISLDSKAGSITVGDTRTENVRLEGSVIAAAGAVNINGASISVLAGNKSDFAIMGGGADLTIGSTETTRLIQVEGTVTATNNSNPVTLLSNGLISLSSDSDYGIDTTQGKVLIGTDATQVVSVDQAIYTRDGQVSLKGQNITLATERLDWAAQANGGAIDLGTNATNWLQVKGGLGAYGEKVTALGKNIRIEAQPGKMAAETFGSTVSIGDTLSQTVGITGELRTLGGIIEVQGNAIAAKANGAEYAVISTGGPIRIGTEGTGDSLEVEGRALAQWAPVELGSADRKLSKVTGSIEALQTLLSLQGQQIWIDGTDEASAIHTIAPESGADGSAHIDVGSNESELIRIDGRVLSENGSILIGSSDTTQVSVNGQIHAKKGNIPVLGTVLALSTSGEEPAALAEGGNTVILGGNAANALIVKGDVAAKSSGTIVLGNEHSGALMHGNFSAEENGSINANFQTADSLLEGDIEARSSGYIVASFTNGAEFRGRVKTADDNAKTVVTLSKGALWNVAGNSNVTSLNLDDTTTVSLKGKASTLAVDQAQRGTGSLFLLDLDSTNKNHQAASEKSDYLFFNGTSEGEQRLGFNTDEAALSRLDLGDKLYFASAADGGISFVSALDLSDVVEQGTLSDGSYVIESEAGTTGTDWFIRKTGTHDNGAADRLSDYTVAGYLLGAEMDRLNKRAGEAQRDGAENGLWVRTRYGRASLESVKNKESMIQVGVDVDRSVESGQVTLGIAFDYTDDDIDFARGDGHARRYGLSFYDTWRNDAGWYTDTVLRVGVIANKMKGISSHGQNLTTRFRNSYASASLEAGRKISFGESFYLEPQAQFQLSVIDGASFQTQSGIRGDEDHVASAAGRLGFRAGHDILDASRRAGALYFKADVLHEFAGDREMRATSADGRESLKRTADGTRTWYDAGFGVNYNLGKSTFLWADAEGIFGGGFGSAWQANAGIRWKF